jgi:hypothetical protein
MIKIRTEITINANIERVWLALTDFATYPTWNPLIPKISGNLQMGEILTVTLSPPGQKAQVFTPVLTVVEKNKELRWVGKVLCKRLFQGEHYFQLEKIDENTTRFIHGEIFSGILAPVLLFFMKKNVISGFEKMNNALKDKVS